MGSRSQYDLQTVMAQRDDELAFDRELNNLRDVLRMLPTGVTVQDEQGRFLLVNDAAAAQFGIAAAEPARCSEALNQRREAGIEALRSGRMAVTEDIAGGKQVL